MFHSTASRAHPSLPTPVTADGSARKLGVEVEFAGLSEDVAARAWSRAAGGDLRQEGASWICDTPQFGACTFYLDTKYREDLDRLDNEAAYGAARMVVPVELVSDPFDPAHLPDFDAALAALRTAGAEGTRARMVYGFGVHLNVEVARRDGDHVGRVVCAYALLEPLLRETIGVDLSRRMLPFVDPYPRALVSALAETDMPDIETLAEMLLAHTTSRNHGLDMLPILTDCVPDVLQRRVDSDTKITPRPAYHYRLPESRIDQEGWGLARDWRLWCLVEQVAERDDALAALKRGWTEWADAPRLTRTGWAAQAKDILKTHNITWETS